MALIIVLSVLVLLSGLLVAFMSMAGTERSATQSAKDSATARQIADSTLNLVVGQIREATTQRDEGVTWASQPGAIRTFSGELSSTRKGLPLGASYLPYNPGNKDYVFKLYSADNLKVKASDYTTQDLPAETGVIEKWDRTNPAADYVDLNEPYLSRRLDLDPEGGVVEPRYPIIDPRAKYTASETENFSPNPGIVDGFDASISRDGQLKLATATGGVGGAVPYLPMPVKWLYVLKDGTIGSARLATANNPIVGRTAFWTDDESCKLNLNTASEGTFWDTPSMSTEQDCGIVDGSGNLTVTPRGLALGAAQPVRGEYQRYPGHPFTTSLSPVLGWLWGLQPSTDIYPSVPAYRNFKEAIYQITPFTPSGAGTSKGATGNPDPFSPQSTAPKLNVVTKHLYATVDELMFKSKRTDGGLDARSLPNEITPGRAITPSALEKSRFFLTTSSRAPDLNLFGRPRVTLWPINSNYDLRTNFDDLFAFASTIFKDPSGNEANDKAYYLTRFNAKSDTADFGTGPSSQNRKMYEYLQGLTGGGSGMSSVGNIPGFGGTFQGKYGADRDQILTEIFDYARSVNLVDTGTASKTGNVFIPYTPRFYRDGYTESYGRKARSIDWSGQVTPLKVGSTAGMGRFITITEAALIFHRTGQITAGQQGLQAVLALEMATPMAGFPAIRETYWTRIVARTPMTMGVGTQSLQDAGLCSVPLYNICNLPAHEVTDGRAFMPTLGFTAPMHYFAEHRAPTNPTQYTAPESDPNRDNSFAVGIKTFDSTGSEKYVRGQTVKKYPYVTRTFPVTAADRDFTFTGPELDVEIYTGEAPDDPRSVLVQTVHLRFPPNPLKLTLPKSATNPYASFANRFDGSLDGAANCINTGGAQDVVRSIELTCGVAGDQRGDMRLAMARTDVPNTFFEPRDGLSTYLGPTLLLHGLTFSHGNPLTGFTGAGTLAAGGSNRSDKPPILPRGINGVKRADGGPGDWDRGLSKHLDGALCNKVDEGNIRFEYTNGNQSYRVPYFHGRNIEDTGQSFYTPNRLLPSVVMLGSLPTGVKAGKPWQTLLFRPDRETSTMHPGARTPPDHLWLDLFHLPVVEPYAISEPFSTAGKVNMNYVIAPFGYAKGDSGNLPNTTRRRSYLRRDTGLRGVLKSTFVTAVPTGVASAGHEEQALTGSIAGATFRYPIDLDRTLDEFEARLNDQSLPLAARPMTLFRSPSEICEIDLVPKGVSVTSWPTFWTANAQTGDNLRERPYAHIYPRLTTKSNVFTVHMICQSIRKAPGSDPAVFDPRRDHVLGQYRGSAVVERFIDPNDPNLRDYDERKEKADAYYRYRVVSVKQFLPR